MGNKSTHSTQDMRRAVAVVASVGIAAGAITAALALWGQDSAGGRADAAAPAASAPADAAAATKGAHTGQASSGTGQDVGKDTDRPPTRAADPKAASVEVTDPMAPPPTVIKAPEGTAGPAKDAAPKSGREAGSEAMASAQEQPRPRAKSTAPLLKSAPKTAHARGKLVAGFPGQVMAPTGGSLLGTSATTTQGKRTQVTLTAHTEASATTVRNHYQKLWASLGLTPRESADGTLSYSGAHETLTLSFPESATDTRYALFGTFRTP